MLITTLSNTDLGFEVRINQLANGRYLVQVFDTDSQNLFPAGKLFTTVGEAVEHARLIAAAGEEVR